MSQGPSKLKRSEKKTNQAKKVVRKKKTRKRSVHDDVQKKLRRLITPSVEKGLARRLPQLEQACLNFVQPEPDTKKRKKT